jgi:uncharacterized protein (TIGR02145 family)
MKYNIFLLLVFYYPIILLSQQNDLLDKNKVVDADGNIYNTVRIRDKIWITENLKTTHYNDGQPIPRIEDFKTWSQLNYPAYCEPSANYDNQNEGLLYNHYVVQKGNVCPQGFNVPSLNVIDSLFDYFDGYDFGYLLGGFWRGAYNKTVDFDNLLTGNVKGFNSSPLSGFNFINGASRGAFFDKNDFYDNGYSQFFESFWIKERISKFDDEEYARVVELNWSEYDYDQNSEINADHIRSGNYIRCYKEYIPTIKVDNTEHLKDKDGNLYKVVKIGNQIWMAEDLKTIPEDAKLVFNEEELEHYGYGSVFYDDFKSSGHLNYSEDNFNYFNEFKVYFKDVCPMGWHLPDQGEWEMLTKQYSIDDLKSNNGWLIEKSPGYYETKSKKCICYDWNDLYRSNKRGCDICRDEKWVSVKTGKFIPERITNYNGTNKSGLNIKPFSLYENGGFKLNKSSALYLCKDHKTKGVKFVRFEINESKINFDKFSDSDGYGHVRCVKD